MQEIKLTFPEIAHFMGKIAPFIPDVCENINELVGKALSLKEIPEEEFLSVQSTAGNLEDAIDEYWGSKAGTIEEKASIRQSIRFIEDYEDLRGVHREIMDTVKSSSFEFLLFLRKAAIIEFKIKI